MAKKKPNTKPTPTTAPAEAAEPPAPPSEKIRVLSGVQPSGKLHLGNYFGAIKQHIEMAADPGFECYYFIANYHSLTTVKDRAALLGNTRDVAITYLSLGLDPKQTVFYRQSDVPEVTELAWLLATVTGMGLLERAHSYKDKVSKGLDASVGLFFYPVLMAADILAPQAHLVPVGQDQQQHVEMTRDMAQHFNTAFAPDAPVFTLPDARFNETPKVPGTTFDKGKIVVVTAHIKMAGAESSIDVPDFVAAARQIVQHAVETDGASTTEAIEAIFAALAEEKFPHVRFVSRDYRVSATMAAGNHRTEVRGDDVLEIEFAVGVPRDVFLTAHGKRIAAKMSKSYGNTIDIFAEGKPLKKTVMAIETDVRALEDPLPVEDDLVFTLYRLFATPAEQAELAEKYQAGGFGYGNAKKALLEKIDTYFAPFRDKRKQLEADPDYVEDVLRDGAKKARAIARQTLDAARAACGIPPLAAP